MYGLLKRAALQPAEEAENKRLIAELLSARSPVQFGKEWRVQCNHDIVSASREEYPDDWVGVEQDRDEHGLVLLRFGGHFIGVNEHGKRSQKTDKDRQMWIPWWILEEFRI